MAGDCGYDEEFVEPPSEHVKCIVCYLVLKQPVQIATCGHRYCSTCFDRVKGYSKHLNAPFTCPVDRKEIDETKVFEDMGMARIVLDLKVKCSCHKDGCKWSGELRELYVHKSQCPLVLKQLRGGLGSEDNPLTMSRMNDRLDRYETSLEEKGREMVQLKDALQKLEENGARRDGEMELLKRKNEQVEKKNEEMEKKNGLLKKMNEQLKKSLADMNVKISRLENEYSKRDHAAEQQQKPGQKRKQGDADRYMSVHVLTEGKFRKWSGHDLFDPDGVDNVTLDILKTEKVRDATKIIAHHLGYDAARCRLWVISQRENLSQRPSRLVANTEVFIASDYDSVMHVFLETCEGETGLSVIDHVH